MTQVMADGRSKFGVVTGEVQVTSNGGATAAVTPGSGVEVSADPETDEPSVGAWQPDEPEAHGLDTARGRHDDARSNTSDGNDADVAYGTSGDQNGYAGSSGNGNGYSGSGGGNSSSDADSAAQQAASDADSAAQQAASDADSAAQQAASDGNYGDVAYGISGDQNGNSGSSGNGYSGSGGGNSGSDADSAAQQAASDADSAAQ